MSNRIERHQIDNLRDRTDIAEVIGRFVALKKSGASWKGLSPFNKEKSPSFFVSLERKTFKCFSSGHGGDVFKFFMLTENLKFPEAVKRVSDLTGIRL